MRGVKILLIIFSGAALVPCCRAGVKEGQRLIKTSEADPGTWMSETKMFELIRKRQGFVDVTDFIDEQPMLAYVPEDSDSVNPFTVPTSARYPKDVHELCDKINITGVLGFVRHFTSYHNRYFSSETGKSSQLWLLSQVKEILANRPNASVKEVDHYEAQKSIVARLPGTDPTLKDEIVVLGAHLDSINSDEKKKPAPGADDNASGTGAVLEVLRLIVMSNVRFKRTVEFHWYAAEEVGYRGSQDIALKYRRKKVNVVGMLNLDVLGSYVEGVNEISIKTDFVDEELTKFVEMLVNDYLDFRFQNNKCGYGCSDHGSWSEYRFRAAFAGETNNSRIHTDRDTIDTLNFVKVKEFIKLAVAFMVEMAEPLMATT